MNNSRANNEEAQAFTEGLSAVYTEPSQGLVGTTLSKMHLFP